jgi:hypothetical protein
MRWPLREGLISYREIARERALEQYRHDRLLWAVLAPHFSAKDRPSPPEVPAILRGNDVHA